MACISLSALSYHDTNLAIRIIHSFGVELTPVHYRRRISRPVSCYALFKWWLLLSQHPGCLSNSTSFVTKFYFGTLADDLGCFPLDREAYPSWSDSWGKRTGIRSLVRQSNRLGPQVDSVSLPPTGNLSKTTPKGISERTSYLCV